MNFSLGIIGTGNMGSAILARLIEKQFPQNHLHVFDLHPEKIKPFLQEGCQELNPTRWSETVDVLILAVKPQSISDVLKQLAEHTKKPVLILSIAAGVSQKTLEQFFEKNMPVIRAMPNTPALIGKGITALFGNAHVTNHHQKQAEFIFSSVGETLWVQEEDQLNAVTALSGSGPAYFFALIEAMKEAGIRLGLSTEHAEKLARETGIGALALLDHTQKSPKELRTQVTSKGGTTEAALLQLTEDRFNEILYRAMSAACERAKTFS